MVARGSPLPWERASLSSTMSGNLHQTSPPDTASTSTETSGNGASTATPAEPTTQEPVDPVVERAVQFLQHEKVRSAPLAAKRKFLENKRLTASQMDEALKRAGASSADVETPLPLQQTATVAATAPANAATSAAAEAPPSRTLPLFAGGILGALAGGALTYAAMRWRAHATGSADSATLNGDDHSGSSRQAPITLKLSDAPTRTPERAPAPSSEVDASPLAALRRMRDAGSASPARCGYAWT